MIRKTCIEPGCTYPVWARKRCKMHDTKINPPKKIKSVKDPKEKAEKIAENKAYYRKMIGLNIIKNKGVCRCDECDGKILKPSGRNVAHILPDSTYPEAYLDELNSFILGKGFGECECLYKFDDSAKCTEMNIWLVAQQRKSKLKQKYNAGSN